MSGSRFRVGLIGAGNISDEYLTSLGSYPDIDVIGVADLDTARAESQAAKYGVPFAGTVGDLLSKEELELVVNLTVPAAHAEVSMAAVAAGKHVWTEKPITVDRASAEKLLQSAAENGVTVGGAPDTILGDGIQTSHRLLDSGRIGEAHTLLTLMQGPGPDAWHPRPQFLFARGAGPLFDIGPYYIATMAMMLGPIETVQALGHTSRSTRTVMAGPDAGATFPVEVPTHVSVLTRFASGVAGTSIYSFESPVRRQTFEISGTEGALLVPVSGFDGPSEIMPMTGDDPEWERVERDGESRARGVGVLEMARALRAGRTPRAGGALAYHVLDTMLAIEESVESGAPVAVRSRFEPVAPLAATWSSTAATLS
jgi:predicted dehydrogenase